MLINKVSVVIVMSQKIQVWETMTVLISSFPTMRAFLAKNMTIAVYKKIKNQCFICDDITRYEWDTWQKIFRWIDCLSLWKKRKEHVWISDTPRRCLGLPLALSDDALLFTLTPGNDYFVLVFMWLTLDQTQLIHKLMGWPIYSYLFRKFCYNWNAWAIM